MLTPPGPTSSPTMINTTPQRSWRRSRAKIPETTRTTAIIQRIRSMATGTRTVPPGNRHRWWPRRSAPARFGAGDPGHAMSLANTDHGGDFRAGTRGSAQHTAPVAGQGAGDLDQDTRLRRRDLRRRAARAPGGVRGVEALLREGGRPLGAQGAQGS